MRIRIDKYYLSTDPEITGFVSWNTFEYGLQKLGDLRATERIVAVDVTEAGIHFIIAKRS